MAIRVADVKTNGFAVPLLKLSDVGVVNEYKPLNLCLVEHLAGGKGKGEKLTSGTKRMKKKYSNKA